MESQNSPRPSFSISQTRRKISCWYWSHTWLHCTSSQLRLSYAKAPTWGTHWISATAFNGCRTSTQASGRLCGSIWGGRCRWQPCLRSSRYLLPDQDHCDNVQTVNISKLCSTEKWNLKARLQHDSRVSHGCTLEPGCRRTPIGRTSDTPP